MLGEGVDKARTAVNLLSYFHHAHVSFRRAGYSLLISTIAMAASLIDCASEQKISQLQWITIICFRYFSIHA